MGKALNIITSVSSTDYIKVYRDDGKSVHEHRALLSDFQNGFTSVTMASGGLTLTSGSITVTSGNETLTAGDLTLSAGVITANKTITGTALSTTRAILGAATASGTAIASGNLVGVRGSVTLSGTITAGGAYLYGAQGKLIVSGTMNHADARLCGMLAQLDISAGTYTAGQMSALWVDAGATASASAVSTKGGGQFNLLRITNTTSASSNAAILVYADADYLMDLGGPGGNADWFDAGTGATAGVTGHLKVMVNGTAKYIRLYETAS